MNWMREFLREYFDSLAQSNPTNYICNDLERFEERRKVDFCRSVFITNN